MLGYVNPNNLQSTIRNLCPGTVGIYEKDIKYPSEWRWSIKISLCISKFVEEKPGLQQLVYLFTKLTKTMFLILNF